MLKFFASFFLVVQALFFLQLSAFSQTPDNARIVSQQNDKWVKIGSESGDFSIDVPSDYGLFYDRDGFTITKSSNDYRLSDVNLYNSFTGETLLSVESYKSGKSAINVLYDDDERMMKADGEGKNSSYKIQDVKIKSRSFKSENYFWTRWYLYYGNYSYVLTAASRNGETPIMKHFFDSISFNKTKLSADKLSAIPFSKLTVTPIEIDEVSPENKSDENIAKTVKPDENQDILPLIIFSKPLPSYTTQARQNNVTGNIKIKTTFMENGRIGKLGLVNVLKDGLVRQAVFATLRTKFLPQKSNEKAVSVTKTLVYTFDIY